MFRPVTRPVALLIALAVLGGCANMPNVPGMPSSGSAPAPGPQASAPATTGPGGCKYWPGTEPSASPAAGAVAGGIIGAVVGRMAAGNSSVARRNATLAGALAGAFAGHALAKNFAVSEQPDGSVKVAMPGGLLFSTGSAQLNADSIDALRLVASEVRSYCNASATVVGHTDSTGSLALNMRLSEDRARSVSTALMSSGLDPSRIARAEGRGPNEPVADNATADGRQRNRRVDVYLMPTSN